MPTTGRVPYSSEDALRAVFKDTRCLVTGGAGFVGSRVAEKLLELGAHVSILDDFTTGREELVPPAAVLHRGSITDKTLVNTLVEEADHVFHLAARVLYIPAYAFGWTPWRSAIWGVGFLATLTMLIAALI